MKRSWAPIPMALLVAFWFGSLGPAVAQISPGPLSAPHADLEGSDQCLKCHSQKKRVSAERCLDCHALLRERIESRQGFHATIMEQGCERCHMEHHGAEFELIYWGEEGEAAFDHAQTSFELQGAHAGLACRTCHEESLVQSGDRLQQHGKRLDRTFLGLDGSACLSCHADEHRGQFADRSCETCHSLEKWTEGSLFRHETARFPLVEKHRQVDCSKCHVRSAGDELSAKGFVRYTGLAYSNCTDCHSDPHEGRLGSTCQQCHSESGWGSVSIQSFNHDRTRFPLVGAHQRIECEGCHRTGVAKAPPRFAKCTDCHLDHHLGQFADRPEGAACDSCHDLQGFRPSTFTLSAHQESDYPLAGAHLAVACDACHTPLDSRQVQDLAVSGRLRPTGSAGPPTHRYTYSSTLCSACHESPHEPGLDRFMLDRDCLACHQVEGWRQIEFDHERTDYSLAGSHEEASCLACHRADGLDDGLVRLAFDGISRDCGSCHEDPHGGQFDQGEEQAVCTRCHSVDSWKRLHFDHNRDSSFPLDGQHSDLPCLSCHRQEEGDEQPAVRYKPLVTTCAGCHAGGSLSEDQGRAR